MIRLLPAACALSVLGACNESPFPDVDLERMINQKRFAAYQASEFFQDGRAMRTPPPDTVARDRMTNHPALSDGIANGAYVERIPIEVSRDVMDRGRQRFEIFCAPCHGVAGDGESMVSVNMHLRRPPPLTGEPIRKYPPGRIFQVVSEGYGLMRSYADSLTIEERWSVIWYLRALQLRSAVSLDRLPLALQSRATTELP
ncbi:MAG TPA: cytochrome c [Polyangiaceae bacterium]